MRTPNENRKYLKQYSKLRKASGFVAFNRYVPQVVADQIVDLISNHKSQHPILWDFTPPKKLKA